MRDKVGASLKGVAYAFIHRPVGYITVLMVNLVSGISSVLSIG